MPDPARRLPARASLEQLRKQAKDLLRQLRAGDPAARNRCRAVAPRLAHPEQGREAALAEAQFVVAREYGFESWALLVRHVEAIDPADRLEQFEQLAEDLLAASRGDTAALARMSAVTGTSYSLERLRVMLEERLRPIPGASAGQGGLTSEDARLLVARQHGFDSWATLVTRLQQPPESPRSAPFGISTSPPFYRIDWRNRTLEPRPPLSDRDWELIADVIREAGITGLNAAGQMTDAAMKRISRLDQLTRLDLEGSRLTDDGLRLLARMPQLEELDLSGWHSPVTDRGLEVLRELPALRRFQMCWPQHVTDSGIANLTPCNRLESVNLLGTPTGDGAIAALAGKPRLRCFRSGSRVSDAGLPLLHQFPIFKRWHGGEIHYDLMSADANPNHLLLDGPFTNHGIPTLAGLDGLFGLSFFWHTPALTSDCLETLALLPNLGFLGCDGRFCDDIAMRHIGALPRLGMLMAQGTVAGDDGFTALSRSRTIEYIWGRECPNLGSRGFAALAAMPALRGLAVSCKNVNDEALSTLPDFPALRELMPMDVSDDGFRHVGRCEQLERLWCMYCRDTGDIATGHIAGLSGLRTYYAGKTRITDLSLKILGRIASLEEIQFWEVAGITDAGLAHLAGLPRLRELSIEGCSGVTRPGLEPFSAAVRVNFG